MGQPGSYYGESGYGSIKGNPKNTPPGLEKYHGTDVFLTDALTIEANAEIDRAVQDRKSFFLYMSHYAVHTPLEPDPRFIDHYLSSDKPATAQYFATLIEGMDKSLGDVMNHLEALDIAENTLVIFLGDNGSDAPLGEVKGHFSSAPLRGKKGTEYEGGTRVPCIVGWAKPDPTNRFQKSFPVKQKAIQQQMGTVMDIYPTILSLTGAKNPQNHVVDGFDLKEQIAGKRNTSRTEKFLLHYPHEHRESHYFTTFRDGDWKLIYWYHPEQPSNPTAEIYNLAVDPFEINDLSASKKDVIKAMIEQMAAQLASEGALYPEDANGEVVKPIIPQ